MNSYKSLVLSFLPFIKESKEFAARLYNELHPLTLCPVERLAWESMEPEDAEDLADSVETLTQKQMRNKLADMGWEDEEMEDTLKVVAIDDSYAISAFLDIRDPRNPRIVMPCDFPAFAKHCGLTEDTDEKYIVNGVLTWAALQEYAPIFAAAKHVLVTMDCEVISFPLPAIVGGRRKLGRTGRLRLKARKGGQRSTTRKASRSSC